METKETEGIVATSELTELIQRTGAKQLSEDRFEVQGPGVTATIKLSVLKELREYLETWEKARSHGHADQTPASSKSRLRSLLVRRAETYNYTGS
ncbi:MAG: hypothetical protein M3Y56_04065 [Armatimonadota bacterium]|nr:hypothetical protein [Armatimonadota bacterium]